MKKHFLFVFLILSFSVVKSQQFISVPVKMKPGGFGYDSLSFNVLKVVDQRKNQLDMGFVYSGLIDLSYPTVVKKGLVPAYERFFYSGLKNTVKGDRNLVVSFRNLVYAHDSLEAKQRKEIRLEIEVDYYESINGKLTFLFKDQKKEIFHEKFNLKQLSRLSYQFFEASLQKVDEKLLSNKVNTLSEPKKSLIEAQESDSLLPTLSIVKNNPPPPTTSNQLQSLDSLPEQLIRPRNNHLITFEKFDGSNAGGYRLRYVGFTRDWDDFGWKPALSVEIEGFTLNKDYPNFNVYYSYFALGVGTIKPLNNYFFLDLNAKIGIGSEIIDRGIFEEDERNTLFGLFFNQRIHLILGKKAGLVLTTGVYQNLFGGTEYINGDIGVIVGGGIKF